MHTGGKKYITRICVDGPCKGDHSTIEDHGGDAPIGLWTHKGYTYKLKWYLTHGKKNVDGQPIGKYMKTAHYKHAGSSELNLDGATPWPVPKPSAATNEAIINAAAVAASQAVIDDAVAATKAKHDAQWNDSWTQEDYQDAEDSL